MTAMRVPRGLGLPRKVPPGLTRVCVCTDTDSSFKNVDRESWSLFTTDAIDNIVIRRQRKRDSELFRRLGSTSTKFGRDSELTDDCDRQNSPSVGA